MTTLDRAFAVNSPRLSPRGVAMAGWAIHLGVIALWVALFAQAFLRVGVGFWSIGIAYIGYDCALLAFVLYQTLPIVRRTPGAAGVRFDAVSPRWRRASCNDPVIRPSLSVLIAAYNEAAVLPTTLCGLLAQSDAPDCIVVADDGSDDGTAAVLTERFGLAMPGLGGLSAPAPRHPSLRWLRLPHGGKATALNAALVCVDTDVVVTLDADTLPAADAIGAIRQAFAVTPELVVAGGVVTPVCGNTLLGRAFQWFQTYEYLRNFVARYAWTRVESLLLISGAFAAFRRDALMTVGGFDPDCLVEDYELIHRLQRHGRDHRLGWRVRVIGRAVAQTDAPGTVRDFLRQRRRWFGGFLQTQYWNRDMCGSPRYGWLGVVMLPVKAVDTVEPIYGLSAFALLIALAVSGNLAILVPVGAIVIGKLALDLSAYLWTILLYRRWTGLRTNFGLGLLAAVLEPFTFTPLRHAGAVLGWWQFLTGRQTWVPQHRRS